jgi:hypothetical protein
MYTLKSDEKTTPLMAYTQNMLVRGDVITRQIVRVSVWLRTEGAPEYIHFLKPQVILMTTSPVRVTTYNEMYLPTNQVICYHLTPPGKDPMDYDETEKNRVMQPVSVLVGSFSVNGGLRVSSQVDFTTSIASYARLPWLSVYDSKISNPSLAQMGEIPVPLLLLRPAQVSFNLNA